MTKGTNDNEIPKPTFVEPPGTAPSRKTIVICGLIVAVALVILLAWRCNTISQGPSDQDFQMLYDRGYAYPSKVSLKITFMAVRARIECVQMGLTEQECPQPTTETPRRILATLMTKRTETNGPGRYGNLYNAELTTAIDHLFYGLITRLRQNPCGPLEYGYVSDRTLNELQASGYIHKCGQGWAINSEWAELIVVETQSQSVPKPTGQNYVAPYTGNTGCDQTLRSALITQRGVGNSQQVNQMVRAIQAQRASDCNQEIWNPLATHIRAQPGETAETTLVGFTSAGCGITSTSAPSGLRVRNTEIPTTLLSIARSRLQESTYDGFARDAEGNIMVEFGLNRRPADRADCWLYIAKYNYWDQKG